MTPDDLRKALVVSFRKLDPRSDLMKRFGVVMRWRQKHAAYPENQTGKEGFSIAIERILFCLHRVERGWPQPDDDGKLDETVPEALAEAAESLGDTRLRSFLRYDLPFQKMPADDQSQVDAIVALCLENYSWTAGQGLGWDPW